MLSWIGNHYFWVEGSERKSQRGQEKEGEKESSQSKNKTYNRSVGSKDEEAGKEGEKETPIVCLLTKDLTDHNLTH